MFVTPDTVAHGQGEHPQHVNSVAFGGDELWGGGASAKDKVYIDLWDDYLERVEAWTEIPSLEPINLPRDEGGPVFERPWQAQAFALVVELYKAGKFRWPEWSRSSARRSMRLRHCRGKAPTILTIASGWRHSKPWFSSRKLVMGAEVSDRRRNGGKPT